MSVWVFPAIVLVTATAVIFYGVAFANAQVPFVMPEEPPPTKRNPWRDPMGR